MFHLSMYMSVSLQESKAPAFLSVAAQCDLHAEVEVNFRQLTWTRNVVTLLQYRKNINIILAFYLIFKCTCYQELVKAPVVCAATKLLNSTQPIRKLIGTSTA